MAVSAQTSTLKTLVIAGTALVLGSGAFAQQAERCEGTLCDLYYGSGGNTPAQPATTTSTTPGVPAGATPMTVPSGGVFNWFNRGTSATPSTAAATTAPRLAPPTSPDASASNSYMHMGTNGVLGDHQERCSGTLCDAYYGSSPSEATGAVQQTATASPPPVERQIVHRHIVHESETRPKCSSPSADPWHCFR